MRSDSAAASRRLPTDARSVGVLLAVALVGLALSAVHWLGIVAGGALVGLWARNWRRGVLAGFAFGVVVWTTFAATLLAAGTLGAYVAMGQIFYLSVAIPVAAGTVGGLARLLR